MGEKQMTAHFFMNGESRSETLPSDKTNIGRSGCVRWPIKAGGSH